MLKREIAEDERKGWADKRSSQQERMLQLDAQMREKVLATQTLTDLNRTPSMST